MSPPTHQGASQSTKELVGSLEYGRLVTFVTSVATVTGYLAGMDDYHWLVIDPDTLDRVLVHKTCPVIRLVAEATLEDEGHRDEITAAIAPYRQALTDAHQIRQPKTPRGSSSSCPPPMTPTPDLLPH